jgi:alpha-glucosidase
MKGSRRWINLGHVILLSALSCHSATDGHSASVRSTFFVLDTFSYSAPLRNGLEVHGPQAVLQAVALQDDVIRIRISRDGILPEDSSWAVLASARREQVDVTTEDNAEAVGFRTKLLRLRIDRKTLRLSLADLRGNV